MKTIFSSISVFLIFALSACHKSDNNSSNNANVMFVNACAGTTNVGVKSNNATVQAASNLSFLANSGYVSMTSGSYSIDFTLVNLGTPLKSGTAVLTAKTNYSVFAGGIVTNPSYVILTDDLSAPSSGMAKVRFVNLSSDTLSETATVGTTNVATGINSQSGSSFTEVSPGSYNIKAGDPANISTVVSINSQQLNAAKIYTIILTGTLLGTGSSALSLTVIGNN